ncbi:MAG: hypothetical protein WC532_01470 [Candidatus Omnitrophota bacterium]
MNKDLQKNIKTFFHYFDHILYLTTDKIPAWESTPLFQILIYSGIIDTLAKCAAGPKVSNYVRFTAFIKNFCEWKEHSKISLPHLVMFLRVMPSPEFEKLRQFTYEKFDTWKKGEVIYLDSDPDYDGVLKLWPKDNALKEPIEKISLESLTHLHLLWKLRNSVVHEMRILGYGMSAIVTKDPGYHQMTHLKNEEDNDPLETWELVYPVSFLSNLIKTGIKNLKMYCEKNRLDPFDRFEFGTYWLGEFNKTFPGK